MTTAAKPGRRTRYDVPRWAEQFPDTPEGLDALASHDEARRLDLTTDPDSIDDPDVRDAFVERLRDEAERSGAFDDEPSTSSEGSGSPDSPAGSGNRGRQGRPGASSPPARLGRAVAGDGGSWLSRPDVDDASGLLLGLIGYAIVVSALRDPASAGDGVKAWLRAKFFNIPASGAQVSLAQQSDAAPVGSLLLAPVLTTNATPAQPAAPANLAGILRQGLPASALAAPRPPAPAGVAS